MKSEEVGRWPLQCLSAPSLRKGSCLFSHHLLGFYPTPDTPVLCSLSILYQHFLLCLMAPFPEQSWVRKKDWVKSTRLCALDKRTFGKKLKQMNSGKIWVQREITIDSDKIQSATLQRICHWHVWPRSMPKAGDVRSPVVLLRHVNPLCCKVDVHRQRPTKQWLGFTNFGILGSLQWEQRSG